MRQDKRASRFDIIVNTSLYDAIKASLDQYVADLAADEYDVAVIKVSGGTAEQFRNLLINEYSLGMVGCVLIGNFPIAWYESECWEEKEHEEFPCDLFYMDLDGSFSDSDSDGLYDTHTGDVTPEIWMGRLTASPLTMGGSSEVALLQNYFRKNHLYRSGRMPVGSRALVYIDDDWASESGAWNGDVGNAYSTRTLVDDLSTTRASDYTARLPQGYDLIEVCVHSSPALHSFKIPDGTWSDVTNSQIKSIDPKAHFYNLFACSGTRFVEENYSAGWDIFQDDYGLCAVGSAKTGSMLAFEDFYTPLSQGKSIGEAFKSWFAANGESDPDWFYGMNIMGDPTLKPHGNTGYRPEPEPPAPTRELTAEAVGADPETDDSPRLLAMPDGKVWAVWKSGRSTVNGRFDIYASVRSGGTWSAPYDIGSAEYWETDPVLGLDRTNRPVAVWSLFTDGYYYNLVYSVWNGSSWSTAQQISDDCSSDLKASLCRDSSGTLWCFWYSRRDLYADIFAATFNGTAWTGATNLTHDSFPDLHPSATATPDGHVWIAHTKYRNGASEIWTRCWNGSAWAEYGPVSGAQHRAYRPAITAGEDGQPIACWQSFDSGNGDICYSRFDGSNWTAPQPVDSDTALDVMPAMAADSLAQPWVVWMSTRAGDWDIYCSQYAGGQWTQVQAVEPGAGLDINPSVSAGGTGDVWVAWQNLTSGNWDIHAKLMPLTDCAEQPGMTVRGVSASPSLFREGITLTYPVGAARVEILDAAGRLVRSLGVVGSLAWDGRDNRGYAVRPGIYFIRSQAGEQKVIRVP